MNQAKTNLGWDQIGFGCLWLKPKGLLRQTLSLYNHSFQILGNKVLAFDFVKASKYLACFLSQQVKSDLTFHVILGECLVVAGDESPVEDDAYLEADPDVHQAVEDNQAGEGKLKSTKMFDGAEEQLVAQVDSSGQKL